MPENKNQPPKPPQPQGLDLPPLDANQILSRIEQLEPNLYHRVINELRAQQLAQMVQELSQQQTSEEGSVNE